MLRRKDCRTVADQNLRDMGEYHRGSDTWLVLASAYVVPARSEAPVLAMHALKLVNDVRARGSRCGNSTGYGQSDWPDRGKWRPPQRLQGS